ncbi:MAG TPA: 16S rRNA (adenine(1518)-N(6)/adenine(1519)-N(6))-dimethyltransferase RsmA [Casimicrobiaceae bacterium]|nr:16S rRNA (adenine(1518)-N(6)/adenine(1519)-N(6))-dimethyltransferase RsmA [Casimicrobiaceae bacterium]
MHGHRARKRFGQNFLADPHFVRRIVDAVDPVPGDNIVEIGPGLAALTAELVARAGHIAAIEIDRDLAARLRARFAPAELALHEADALDFDYACLGADLRVVGNLPYNISSPLLFRLVECEATLRDAHVMLQKEVVARMAAAPSTSDYGRLSVMLQATFRIERLFVVPAGAFRPVPKVESAVARLVPLRESKPRIADRALFARVVAAAFAQRRKTLRNALAALCEPALLVSAGVDPGARGEMLSVASFATLSNAITDAPEGEP